MDPTATGRTILEIGRHLLTGSLALTAAVLLLSLLSIAIRGRRLVSGARAGLLGVFVLVGGASASLVSGFLTGQYDNEYVFNYSERALALPFKVAGLWAGLDGSILFWCLILAGFAAAVAVQHFWSARHPVGRRMEPWVYVVLSAVLLFFLLVTQVVANPFGDMDLATRMAKSAQFGIAMDGGGHLLDGHGLNPQLENYWMAIHPPSLYLGFVGFSVPFAFAIAALAARETGDYWIRITRRWTLVSWFFLTNGIILGGLWAYEMLGWGGYWAWDPVENASILPWFTGTAFLHSVMIQERRDMLKAWNVFLIFLTFLFTITATFMTRSGVVASIHAFSEGSTGVWFLGFMGITIAACAFLLAFRARDLRGTHRLESLLSREAAFYFNNLALVALAFAIFFLSFFTRISHDFLGRKLSVGIPHYNLVATPLFAILILLKGIGPLIGWVKASGANLRRNFLGPGIVGLGTMAAAFAFSRRSLVPDLYPVSLLMGLSTFVGATIWVEFRRGLRTRMRHHGEGPGSALVSLFVLNNRRYGGYLVHLGFVVIVFGVVASAFFRSKEDLNLEPDSPGQVGRYTVTVDPFDPARDFTPEGPGRPYAREVARFRIADASGNVVADLRPERHFYQKQQINVSTPAISRNFINDYYVHFSGRDRGKVVFEIFVNPFVNWIWAGWLILIAGSLVAILPMPVRRIGLAE